MYAAPPAFTPSTDTFPAERTPSAIDTSEPPGRGFPWPLRRERGEQETGEQHRDGDGHPPAERHTVGISER